MNKARAFRTTLDRDNRLTALNCIIGVSCLAHLVRSGLHSPVSSAREIRIHGVLQDDPVHSPLFGEHCMHVLHGDAEK